MPDLLSVIAPYVDRTEALAEALLVHALSMPSVRHRFLDLIGMPLDPKSTAPVRQQRSQDGTRRHDVVLIDAAGNSVRLELKGYAPFTRSQRNALALGPRASKDNRIDVVIAPQPARLTGRIHRNVVRLDWREVDRVVGTRYGSFSDLWLGESVIKRADVERDAARYVAYWNDKMPDATWELLWKPIDFLKGELDEFRFGKTDGIKRVGDYWYYGAWFGTRGRTLWLGWVFHTASYGRVKDLRLIIEDERRHLRRSSLKLRSSFPELKHSVELWPNGNGDAIDLVRTAKRIRRLVTPAA